MLTEGIGMDSSLRFDRAPRRVYWEVTRACDLACRHCRAVAAPDPYSAELTGRDGLALIDQLARFGAPLPHLVLTGGDPLKRPDLFALIAAARARGFGVSVAPSATPRLTSETIERLTEAGVQAVSLSVDGSDAARHDALRGVAGCFDRTIAAARACARTGLRFQVNTLVSEETLDDVPAIRHVAAGLGAARWSLFFLVTVGRGTVLHPITAEACEQLFERLLPLIARPGPVIATTEAPHFRRVVFQRTRSPGPGPARLLHQTSGHGAGIRDGNGIMFISHTGWVYPSGFLPLPAGCVTTADPVDLYRDSSVFRAMRRPDLLGGRCGRCEWRERCGGSRARAFAATGDPLGEDPLCSYEPVWSIR
jgi:AdoMet-dependent heme synthase